MQQYSWQRQDHREERLSKRMRQFWQLLISLCKRKFCLGEWCKQLLPLSVTAEGRERKTAASLVRPNPPTRASQHGQRRYLPFFFFVLLLLLVKDFSAKCTVLYCNSVAKLDDVGWFFHFQCKCIPGIVLFRNLPSEAKYPNTGWIITAYSALLSTT